MYGNLLERLKDPFLYAAAEGGRLEECETLIELGANVNYKKEDSNGETEDGYSPLLIAAKNGHKNIVSLLLANGADTQLLARDGSTVLHISSSIGDENLCALFLQNRCSPHVLNLRGKTPIDIAKEKGFFILGEMLLQMSKLNNTENKSDELVSRIMNNSLEVINSHYGQDGLNENRLRDLPILQRIKTPGLYNGLFIEGGDDGYSIGNIEYDSLANEGSESKSNQVSEENNSHCSSSRDICSDENNSNEYCYEEVDFACNSDDTESIDYTCSISKDKKLIQNERERARKAELLLALSETMCHKLRNEYIVLKNELEAILGENLHGKDVTELEAIEIKLMESLHKIKLEKEKATQNLLQHEEKKHVCIICQSDPKCVLLMPCRHLCVCKNCSIHDELGRCPLCRESISQKIFVYS